MGLWTSIHRLFSCLCLSRRPPAYSGLVDIAVHHFRSVINSGWLQSPLFEPPPMGCMHCLSDEQAYLIASSSTTCLHAMQTYSSKLALSATALLTSALEQQSWLHNFCHTSSRHAQDLPLHHMLRSSFCFGLRSTYVSVFPSRHPFRASALKTFEHRS